MWVGMWVGWEFWKSGGGGFDGVLEIGGTGAHGQD